MLSLSSVAESSRSRKGESSILLRDEFSGRFPRAFIDGLFDGWYTMTFEESSVDDTKCPPTLDSVDSSAPSR